MSLTVATPVSSAVATVMILKVEPGSYASLTALLDHIVCINSVLYFLYASLSVAYPEAISLSYDMLSSSNGELGSKGEDVAMARIAPVDVSITIPVTRFCTWWF